MRTPKVSIALETVQVSTVSRNVRSSCSTWGKCSMDDYPIVGIVTIYPKYSQGMISSPLGQYPCVGMPSVQWGRREWRFLDDSAGFSQKSCRYWIHDERSGVLPY